MKKVLSLFLIICMCFQITYAEDTKEYNGPTLEEIKEMDMTTSCGLTAKQLEKGLLYELKGMASDYLEIERYVSINAVFKAAQDALESDWGRSCFQTNNISGFFTNNSFESKTECLFFVSEKLHLWYLTSPDKCKCGWEECKVGQFYNGTTIYDVSIKYCPAEDGGVNTEYGDKICQIAYEIYYRALTDDT